MISSIYQYVLKLNNANKKSLRLESTKIQASEILIKLLAEREGFEPSVRG